MTASRRDRMRPFEVIGIAVIVAVFTGIVVISTTRNLTLAAIWLGVAFIAMLVISATVVLMIRPRKEELADIEELRAAAPAKAPGAPAKKKPTTPHTRSAGSAAPEKKK
jgi:ABC-type nickel/cobalt efflux system permease component RcnA